MKCLDRSLYFLGLRPAWLLPESLLKISDIYFETRCIWSDKEESLVVNTRVAWEQNCDKAGKCDYVTQKLLGTKVQWRLQTSLVILEKFWDQFIKLTFRIGILQKRMILIVAETFFNLLGISRPSFNASRLVYVLV